MYHRILSAQVLIKTVKSVLSIRRIAHIYYNDSFLISKMAHNPKLKSAKSIRPLELPQSLSNPYQRMSSLKSMVVQQNSPRMTRMFDNYPSGTILPTLPISRQARRTFVIRQSPIIPGFASERIKPGVEQVKSEEVADSPVKMEDRYDLKDIISSTDYADVYFARDKFDDSKVVIKIINSLRLFSERACKERLLLQKLAANGKGLLKTDFSHANSICFVLEHCYQSLATATALNTQTIRKIAFSLIKAIKNCHSIGIVHANLTPANIMFGEKDLGKLRLTGLSESSLLSNKLEPKTFNRFRAPELILGCPFNTTVDIWSFGCILAEMVIDGPLFSGENDAELLESIMNVLGRPPYSLLRLASKRHHFFTENFNIFHPISGKEIAYVSSLRNIKQFENSPGVLRLVEACLDWNPVNRLQAIEILRHPYFNMQRSSSRLPQIDTKIKRQITSNFREWAQTPR